jgi:phosphate transport system substrate-binding protein
VAAARVQGFELRSAACEHLAGWDHAVVVVHPSNPTAAISVAQLATAFRGVGSLTPVVTGLGTAPRALLDDLVLGPARAPLSPRALLTVDEPAAVAQVARDPNGIALVRLVHVSPAVRAVSVVDARGVAVRATRDAVRGGQYPLARPLRIYTRAAPIGPTRALVDLALSAAGQQVIERAGFIAR